MRESCLNVCKRWPHTPARRVCSSTFFVISSSNVADVLGFLTSGALCVTLGIALALSFGTVLRLGGPYTVFRVSGIQGEKSRVIKVGGRVRMVLVYVHRPLCVLGSLRAFFLKQQNQRKASSTRARTRRSSSMSEEAHYKWKAGERWRRAGRMPYQYVKP